MKITDAIHELETRMDRLDARGDVAMSKRSDGFSIGVTKRWIDTRQSFCARGRYYDEEAVLLLRIVREGYGADMCYRVSFDPDTRHPITDKVIERWNAELA